RHMAKNQRITGVVLLGTALLGGLFMLATFAFQSRVVRPNELTSVTLLRPRVKTGGATDDRERPAVHSEPALTLSTEPSSEKKLQAVRDHVRQESWAEATHILQTLLDGPDAFVAAGGANGNEPLRWTTLHAEADRLLGELPAAGRVFYELTQGNPARVLLARAKDQSDAQLLAEVSRRYRHTAAGAEATRLLG